MKESSQVVDEAMLGLLKLGIPLAGDDAPVSANTDAQNPNLPRSFRDALIDEILEKRPGLTREKLSRQMDEMGF